MNLKLIVLGTRRGLFRLCLVLCSVAVSAGSNMDIGFFFSIEMNHWLVSLASLGVLALESMKEDHWGRAG